MKSNVGSLARCLAVGGAGLLASGVAMAAGVEGPAVAGIPVDFILFALTLLGVAIQDTTIITRPKPACGHRCLLSTINTPHKKRDSG